MNVQNDKNTLTDSGSVLSRAYEINAHTMAVVNAAIASGVVTADKVPDMIRDVHKAFAESYLGYFERPTDVLETSTAVETVDAAIEDVVDAGPEIDDAEPESEAEATETFVSIYADPYDAVTDELVHCLIDGVGKKMLKRYIRAKYNLSWEQYLQIFDLPTDYPSVAPKYSASKAEEAKALGLGSTVPKTPRAVRLVETAAESTPMTTSVRRRRQRDQDLSGRIEAVAKVA